jgi:hypothetical protein
VSKKYWFLLTLALLLGSGFGFLVSHFLGIVARSFSPSTQETVSKTVTITRFACGISNYDADIGQFCVVDKIPVAHQPTSMNCLSTATFSSPDFTLAERCDPNGSLLGNPFYVAWKSGYLELFVEDGTYTFTPPRVVTYSALT